MDFVRVLTERVKKELGGESGRSKAGRSTSDEADNIFDKVRRSVFLTFLHFRSLQFVCDCRSFNQHMEIVSRSYEKDLL